MPTQSRDALWSCDFCGLQGLHSFEQTKAHEIDCRKRQRPGESGSALSYAMPPSETHAYIPQPGVGPGPGPAGTADPHADPHMQISPSKMRSFRLLGPAEGQHLDMADAVACQNVELFEASQQQIEDNEAIGPAGESISLGQVGIRCIHCLPGNAYSTYYPTHTDCLATFVQMLADRHLSLCTAAPAQVRQILEQKAARRQQDHEQRRQPTQDEERQQMALYEHCRFFAGNVGLLDKYPPKSGIAFRDNGYRHMEAQSERYINEQLPPMRGSIPGGTPFQAPPPRSSSAHQMMEGVASTPLARRNKHPGLERDYAPPSAERRDFMSQAIDRREYPPPGSERDGYPAFQPHMGGLRRSYPSEGLQDRTPAGHGPMEHSEAVQQQTPQGSLVESPYAQSPYGMPPPEFPYFQDMNGTWLCRYCSHVHPQYRDQGAVWASASSPPPGQFIDQHLSICRYYNQAPPPSYYDAPPAHMSPYNYGPPSSQFGGQYHPPSWGPPAGPGGQFATADASYSYHPPPGDPAQMYAPPPIMERDPPPSRPSRATSRVPPQNVSEAPDHETLKAIEVLMAADKLSFGTTYTEREARGQLVLEEDKLLLTKYFYHLMRQLRLCRFAEADRKTRGGKRESIKVGYGGLQCVHCTDAPNSRKFFWSNVDRLANSFAEIPGHVLKCRRCPVPVKNALIALKKRHPEQMARLPRGSQKVFFRRMWRRLHDEDPEPDDGSKSEKTASAVKSNDENIAPSNSASKPTVQTETNQRGSPENSSDESCFLVERTTTEAAKALARSSTQPMEPASPSSRIMLALAEDKEWLSDMDCFIRRNLEVFCANEEDVEIAQQDRKYPIHIGQVGIRCMHCAMKNGTAARGTAVAYPYSINGVYESVREFQRLHLESCSQVPDATRKKLAGFKGSSSLSSVLRRYYVLAAKALGMHDTADGIRSGGDCVPLGSSTASAFSFNDWRQNKELPPSQSSSGDSGFLQTAVTPLESRKRKTSLSEEKSPPSGSSKKSREN